MEAELQALVIDAAKVAGWLCYHTHDSRRSAAGFPDLVLVKGRRVWFVELKTTTGRLSPDQHVWMGALAAVDTVSSGVIRPEDADEFLNELVTRE